jgi:DNA-binding GntR family transcriptional regulator
MVAARKKDYVRDEILQRLLAARYHYGERILVKELSEETGISRQPIMSALTALSTEGFVNVIAQVGCVVVSPSPREVADFYLMFGRLEGLMAELAAKRRSDEEIVRLQFINDRIKAIDRHASDANEQYRYLNRDFHAHIHTMAGSALLHERQSNVFAMSDFFIGQSVGFLPHLSEAANEHDRIIASLERRDEAEARETMEEHIAAVGRMILAANDRNTTL